LRLALAVVLVVGRHWRLLLTGLASLLHPGPNCTSAGANGQERRNAYRTNRAPKKREGHSKEEAKVEVAATGSDPTKVAGALVEEWVAVEERVFLANAVIVAILSASYAALPRCDLCCWGQEEQRKEAPHLTPGRDEAQPL